MSFYHSDQVGSTLALTDSTGSVTDKYTYSPFGELLGHTGTSTQPYTFVGTFGVRQEGNLYQMRLRYYDPTTAKFLSKEPIWPQTAKPELLNPYQYVMGQPLRWADVTGANILTDLWAFEEEGGIWKKTPSPSHISSSQGENTIEQFTGIASGNNSGQSRMLHGNRETVTKTALAKTVKNKAGERAIAKAQKRALAKKIAKRIAIRGARKALEKKLTKKFGKKIAKAMAKKIAAAALKKLNLIGTLVDGGLSIYDLGRWAVSENAGKEMQKELSYKVVELAEGTSVGQSIVRGVGRCVSWICGD